jgi:hypothetical protein
MFAVIWTAEGRRRRPRFQVPPQAAALAREFARQVSALFQIRLVWLVLIFLMECGHMYRVLNTD